MNHNLFVTKSISVAKGISLLLGLIKVLNAKSDIVAAKANFFNKLNSKGIVLETERDFYKDQQYNIESLDLINDLKKQISSIAEWNADTIFQSMKSVMNEQKVKMPLFYKLFTGKERGLPLPQILEILGKERSVVMLEKASRT